MSKLPNIQFNPFVLVRQTKNSRFTCWTCSNGKFLDRVRANWDRRVPGYRDGVVLVPISPSEVYAGVVTLKEGDKLGGKYEARRAGEEPRKHVELVGGKGSVFSRKLPALRVDVVLYRADVLAEEEDNEIIGEWDIISVNGSPTEEAAPLRLNALLANHFEISGGTATGWDAERFEAEMKKSFLYWKDKALIG